MCVVVWEKRSTEITEYMLPLRHPTPYDEGTKGRLDVNSNLH
jgi:hypothetical protein